MLSLGTYTFLPSDLHLATVGCGGGVGFGGLESFGTEGLGVEAVLPLLSESPPQADKPKAAPKRRPSQILCNCHLD